ncbi:MAG TPA: asparagine synthetase B [Candidatus Krumholzibacteria bacterium]|nr:asparagine synthetase B [Candidatus Krumholzibacteria bacterium]HPD72340.1 asparagine synthetase B [Candidatus Krumholzibacteria bacterium]HRY40728.1 asparagine synthetase B [Candidatus Krumholzibacteria bacterium]
MTRRLLLLSAVLVAAAGAAAASHLLVPMDLAQDQHLKAYGHTYHALQAGEKVTWLLNYRGGSFLMLDTPRARLDARLLGVRFEELGEAAVQQLRQVVQQENMDEVLLEKPPRIAVYSPPNMQPWDDAVTLALEFAEIPFDTVYDVEVLRGRLFEYDWLHLHHEDFTGQYGKFWGSFGLEPWYIEQQELNERLAQELGYPTVWQLKHAVALSIRDYVEQGGFLFAMCSAVDTIDIALAFLDTDIVPEQMDGSPVDPNWRAHADFEATFAFENFNLYTNPLRYEFSDLDTSDYATMRGPEADYFTLFDFAAKYDPVPAMLTQNHVAVINGFLGQTTGFHERFLKRAVIQLAKVDGTDEVKYLHGKRGQGTYTFLGGHDPEDYQHRVGDPPTVLDLYPTSPGYRLILNNVLFPAARKKPQKT